MKKLKEGKGGSSPFFANEMNSPSKSISSTTSSQHFVTSPSSAYGSTQRMKKSLDFSIPIAISGEILTDCSEAKLELIRQHFQCCPQFRETYRKKLQRKDRNIADFVSSIRHLCPYACYLRAFSPVREWHYLRKAVVELCDDSPGKLACLHLFGRLSIEYILSLLLDKILQGWKCRMHSSSGGDKKEQPYTRVIFCSPDDKVFNSRLAALRHLGLLKKSESYGLIDRVQGKRRKRKILCGDLTPDPDRRRRAHQRPPIQTTTIQDVRSPFGLLEELFPEDPWRLLLSTILLNRTTRGQVDIVLHKFLSQWPTANTVIAASYEDIVDTIRPLGICNRRAKSLIQFSKDYLECIEHKKKTESLKEGIVEFKLSRTEVLSLHNCGVYAYDAYRIFIQKSIDIVATDHALQDYIDYQRGVLTKK